MLGVLGQSTRDERRTPRQAVDLGPAFRGLRQDAQHVVAGDAVGAGDDGCVAIFRLGEGGEAVVDAAGEDCLGGHGCA